MLENAEPLVFVEVCRALFMPDIAIASRDSWQHCILSDLQVTGVMGARCGAA